MNEGEVILRLQNGDISALEFVYKEYVDRLYSFSLSICKSKETAEDVTADIFIMLYHYLSSGKQISNLKSFLYTSVRNATYDKMKILLRDDTLPEDDIIVSNELDISEKVAVSIALKRLSSNEREIVLLYCYEGFLHKEIANILNIPEGTVRWKYRNAIIKLRSMLGGNDNDSK
ncbi:MAG: hypothetical protein A2Y15_02875 [Clostridiales bacterium GWF2_36_10]|nr:MAG: hypothetical protein A2Y15_02875 [Clostridiales bacterium GWF2_36_10]HAN20917.1 hypothetical protein [Clostridiales bacterium]